jgi:hypothetical protein
MQPSIQSIQVKANPNALELACVHLRWNATVARTVMACLLPATTAQQQQSLSSKMMMHFLKMKAQERITSGRKESC